LCTRIDTMVCIVIVTLPALTMPSSPNTDYSLDHLVSLTLRNLNVI